MSFEVKALYDFDGEPNTAEMSIVAGEILKITRVDVGEGWWEGLNSVGKSGLFPQAYVEKITATASPIVEAQNTSPTKTEEWDDDWDNDTYSEIGQNNNENIYMNDDFSSNYDGGEHHFPDNKGTVSKKSLNRFSSFVKNGGEDYLLGQVKVQVSDDQKIRIIQLDEMSFAWPQANGNYTVQVTSPKKESKLKGLKSYIAYQLTPSFNNIQVSRRYKHFDWLHERLSEKFALLAVPPLPDKQISGRYEGQFIEHRRAQLQEFVDYVCRHPILSRCEVWQHFLTCTEEKLWKQGKRQAEKDQLIGAAFCLCIEAPERTLLPSVSENLESENLPFINRLDNVFKVVLATTTDASKKYKTLYSKESLKIGQNFFALGTSIDNTAIPCKLAQFCKHIGTAYMDIGKLYEQQPMYDWDPLGDKFYLYRGITTSFQGIFTVCKGASNKRKECEKTMSGQVVNEIKSRCDTLTYTAMSELNHFKNERETDLRDALKRHIEQQIAFHQNIVATLQKALVELH
ncbi:PREDICTED: sorting nexin-18 [Nicrophorus vespilloides]|uniref:Sorting nexin-18 n=1 Tax=Nicrophorus vespilloides TaxID=110193 RepID=A0ABM1MZH5_NICVS|nr:PREDICTED: sorting nexin-18 [Nicrophorus vespilloides]